MKSNPDPELKAKMRELGRRGGLATSQKYGADHYKEICPLGGRASKGVPKRKKVLVQPPAPAQPSPMIATLDEILADLEGQPA